MRLYIYSIRDKKLQSFEPPVFKDDEPERCKEKTARGLRLIEEKDKPRCKDMALYFLGEFDDESGKFELLDHEEKLLDYEDYIQSEVKL